LEMTAEHLFSERRSSNMLDLTFIVRTDVTLIVTPGNSLGLIRQHPKWSVVTWNVSTSTRPVLHAGSAVTLMQFVVTLCPNDVTLT
jgi:ribosomal protein L18E